MAASASECVSVSVSAALLLLLLLLTSSFFTSESSHPTPAPWPLQFHSVLFMNKSNGGGLQMIDLWYDWPNGRNFNIIRDQLGEGVKYDAEWNNGTSFIYTPADTECKVLHLEVGILRPNWLDGADYLGQRYFDGFLCNVWEKVDFIWYYEDVLTRRPVHWTFYTGYTAHVMTFEVGAVLDDAGWQAPVYCFSDKQVEKKTLPGIESVVGFGSLLRLNQSSI
ncbi:Uncharacterized protein At4g14100 [Linum grandiflorum]